MTALTCAFGSPWNLNGCGPCLKCQREAARMESQFWRDVFFGRFDADGYTAADRQIQARRQVEQLAVSA